ncbi:MAG TPA: LptF/LptG family permease [Treponemataceae bacterium]|nr:LptF/LptG family permease [Treponemataceae bacterium]
MRKTLFLYIAKELILYFVVSFLFFFLIFFVNQILLMAEDILSKKAPIQDVLLLIIFSLPAIIATSAPFAALVGTLMGLGRMVTDREILSMNALGIPIRFILLPVLVIGFAISLVSFFTNDILLPAGTIQFTKTYRKIITSTPALELESNSVKRNQNAVVISGSIKNGKMDNILVIDTDSSGNRRVISSSDASVNQSSDPSILMTIGMNNALVTSLDKKKRFNVDIIEADTISYNILSKNILPSYSNKVTPKEMSSRDLYSELKIKKNEDNLRTYNLYRMEFHKKFSIPFGAFFFVILAFPLGLIARNNGQSVGFILGLIIAVLYWAMLIGGQTLSIRLGFDGFLMMWIPNIVIFVFGLILMGKTLLK